MSAAVLCGRIFRRQLVLAFRRPIEIANPLLFFLMVVALFPLGLGPEPAQLADFAPGILWIIALLANLLTSDAVFRSDFDDGSLEQLLLAPQPLYLSVLAYVGAHWAITGVTLALVSPLFALMLNLPAGAIPVLMGSLLLGSAVLSLLGGLVGVLVGVGGSYLFNNLGAMRTELVTASIPLAFGAAAIVGIFFGYYPATKAAKLDPIEALRRE